MPNSYYDINYTNQTSVAFTNTDLKYLETAHLQVIATNTVSGESTTFLQTGSPTFTVSVSSGTTTLDISALTGSFPTGTNQVRVARVTPSDNLLTNFVNSSLLRAEDLNQNSEQLLFVLQEQLDSGEGSLPLLPSNDYDAGGRNIINLKDGAAAQDAATFGQLSVIAGGITNSPSVPQVYTFTLGTGGQGTVSGSNTTFTLSPTPTSNIAGTFIVEVAGVIQRPDTDFTVSGNILTLLNTDLTTTDFDGTFIIVQNFGVSRNVFSFPVTGEAETNTQTPITLKGAASGDSTALLDVKDSSNNSNTSISAGGTIKTKIVEPVQSGTLTVNPTTITTTGTISSGGNLSVGSSFGVTQSTGDVTANKITLGSTSGFGEADVVTKAYVDANGGAGGTLGADIDLNTLTAPQRSSGVVPSPASTYNYPPQIQANQQVIVIVNRLGGSSSSMASQEIIVKETGSAFSQFRFIRFYDGANWGSWTHYLSGQTKLNDIPNPDANVSMAGNRLINVATPTATSDATTKFYVDNQFAVKRRGVIANALFKWNFDANSNGSYTFNSSQIVEQNGVSTFTADTATIDGVLLGQFGFTVDDDVIGEDQRLMVYAIHQRANPSTVDYDGGFWSPVSYVQSAVPNSSPSNSDDRTVKLAPTLPPYVFGNSQHSFAFKVIVFDINN